MITIDPDFRRMLTGDYRLVTVNVLYFMPDQSHLVNEFIWQTLDLKPRYPRVERFLDYWRREIDAVIKQVVLTEAEPLRTGSVGWQGSVLPI